MNTKRKFLASTLLAAAAMSFCTTSANAATLTWAGTDDHSSWNYTDTNWSNGSTFSSGDNAKFDDSAKSSEVYIEDEITAGAITISSGSYIFTLSDDVSLSATSLTINSGASLEITGSGTFTTDSSSSSTTTIDGDLTISAGKTTFGGAPYLSYVYIGYTSGSSGTIEISGGKTTFENYVSVGYSGTGTLTISGGETTFSTRVDIGDNSSSSGTMEITGGTTTFGSHVYVGLSGTGELTISGGETTFGGYLSEVSLGHNSGSSGTLTISGGKTTFDAHVVHVGYSGTGTLTISGGETTFSGSVDIGGNTSSSSGTLTITGGKTSFSAVYVGSSGTGSLTISGGETTFGGFLSYVYIGYTSGSKGTMEITGGETTFKGDVYFGGNGTGTGELKISGGETTFSGYAYVGYYGTGKLTITDGDTTFSSRVYIGYNSGSSGTMEISGGETNFVGAVSVGNSGTGELTITGGETTFSNSVTVADGSSLSLTGGTITLFSAISNSGTVTVNNDVVFVLDSLGSNGTYTVITGDGSIYGWSDLTTSNFSLNGKIVTGRSTFSVETNGQVTIEYVEAADLVWNGTASDNVWTETRNEEVGSENKIWKNGEADDYFYSYDNVIFGDDGTKSVVVSGKVEADNVTVTGSGYTFTFDEGASLVANTLIVDGGSLTITEGKTTIEGAVTVNGESSLTVSDSGSLTATSADISGTATVYGTMELSDALSVSGSLKVDGENASLTAASATVSGALTVSGGSLEIADGLTSTGSVTVGENANLSIDGTIDLSSAIANEGTITLGDEVSFVLDNLEGVATNDGVLYTFIDGGDIEGWDSLTYKNFEIDGDKISSARQINFNTDDGSIIYNGEVGATDLVWNGTAGDVWSDGTGTDLPQDWKNGERADAFYNGDNVTFGSDGEKSVTISGKVEAGTVTVTGEGYKFSFDESKDSSLTADSLTIDSGASLTLAGSGELTTDSATISGKLEISSGEATITTVEVSSEGALKVSGGTTTADSIEVAGSIELTGGELTVKIINLYDRSSSGSFSGGVLNISEITGDGSLSFGNGLTVNLYDTTSLSLTSDITLSGSVTFNAEDGETIELSGTLSGSGKLVKDGDGTLTLSGDNTFSGGTTISSGTIVAQSDTALGSGSIAIDDGATLEIPTSREFTNATSGNGTMSITNDATVSFGSNVGVKTLEVTSGTTLSGSTTLTHSNAQLVLAGELALDASTGEQVSFTNGGTVILEDTATLKLSGISLSSIKPLSDSSEIGPGSNITIFSGATVEGDIAKFLATDSTLYGLSGDYAVVYDASKGLSVMILESGNVSSITSGVRLHDGIGSSFISAIISDEDLEFGTGFENADDLQSLSNPIVRALATGNISEAAKMFDTLAPNDYAAMVAMPTTSFYNDVKAIDNRLAARRGPIDENARWEFFAQAQGTFIENDDASDTQTFDFDLYGVLAGADYRVNEGLTVGVTVGYDYGKADIHNSGGKIESDDVRITLFAGQQIGEMFFVNAGAQVGYGHYEAKRKTAYGNANGDTDGWNAGVFADVGMMLTLSEELKIAARPYVGLAYLHSEVGRFDDNLFDVDDFHGDSLRASIGCRLFWGFDLAEAAWTVGLDASYSHDFCGDEVDIDATYMDTGKDFGITAKALSKDIFSLGPTVSVGLTKSIDIFAGYAFQAGTDSSIGHNLNAGLKVTF